MDSTESIICQQMTTQSWVGINAVLLGAVEWCYISLSR